MTTPDGLTAESKALLRDILRHVVVHGPGGVTVHGGDLRDALAAIEAAAVARHVAAERGTPSAAETGCDGLREVLAALMRKWGQHSGGCCTFDESGAVVVTPESCVCRDPERTAQRLLGMYGRPDGAALAPTVAASEEVGPATGPVMPGTNIEAYGAVAIECEHGYDVFPMCDAAPSPATEAER